MRQASGRGLVISCALLAAGLAPVAIGISALQDQGWGSETLVRAALGGSICWVAASLALCSTWLAQVMQAPVQGVLLGMLFRMGLPLLCLIGLRNLNGPLVPAGVATTILGVYLVALMMETLLALRMISPVSCANESRISEPGTSQSGTSESGTTAKAA